MLKQAKKRKFYGRAKDSEPSTKIGVVSVHSNLLMVPIMRAKSKTRKDNIFSMVKERDLMSTEVATGANGKMVKPTAKES